MGKHNESVLNFAVPTVNASSKDAKKRYINNNNNNDFSNKLTSKNVLDNKKSCKSNSGKHSGKSRFIKEYFQENYNPNLMEQQTPVKYNEIRKWNTNEKKNSHTKHVYNDGSTCTHLTNKMEVLHRENSKLLKANKRQKETIHSLESNNGVPSSGNSKEAMVQNDKQVLPGVGYDEYYKDIVDALNENKQLKKNLSNLGESYALLKAKVQEYKKNNHLMESHLHHLNTDYRSTKQEMKMLKENLAEMNKKYASMKESYQLVYGENQKLTAKDQQTISPPPLHIASSQTPLNIYPAEDEVTIEKGDSGHGLNANSDSGTGSSSRVDLNETFEERDQTMQDIINNQIGLFKSNLEQLSIS